MKTHLKAIAATVSILLVILVAALVWKSQNAPHRIDTPATIDPVALKHADQASEYRLQGNDSQSVEEYKKSLEIQPDPDVQIQLGISLVRAGRREEAIKTLREVAQQSGRAGDAAKVILDRVERDPNWGTVKK